MGFNLEKVGNPMRIPHQSIFKLAFILMGLCLSLNANGQNEMPAIPVEAQLPIVAPLDESLHTTGSLLAFQGVDISPEVSGTIKAIHFKEGQPVTKGDLLIELNHHLLAAELTQAQAQLAKSQLHLARQEALLKNQTGKISDRDDANAQVAIDAARVQWVKSKIHQTQIRAPFSGVIGLSQVDVGEYVQPGNKLVNLESIEVLKVDFRLPEVFLSVLKMGQSIKLTTDAYPNREFKGTVYAIDPHVDELGRSILMRARLDNKELELRPGIFARVNLILKHNPQALLLFEQAVLTGKDSAYVYIVEDGKAKKVRVKTGLRQNGQVEILSGIQAQDFVIQSGQMRLFDGAAVHPIDN